MIKTKYFGIEDREKPTSQNESLNCCKVQPEKNLRKCLESSMQPAKLPIEGNDKNLLICQPVSKQAEERMSNIF